MTDPESARFYARANKRHQSGPRAVGWKTARAQRLRFEALDDALGLAGCRVLDVGCGVGDLCAFMDERKCQMEYVGIDEVPEMITTARAQFPGREFHHSSLASAPFDPKSFDVVLASGTFSRLGQCDAAHVAGFAAQMFGLCRRAIAFNSLSQSFARNEHKGFALDPAEIITPLLDISPWLGMEHTPETGDVTFVLRRAPD